MRWQFKNKSLRTILCLIIFLTVQESLNKERFAKYLAKSVCS